MTPADLEQVLERLSSAPALGPVRFLAEGGRLSDAWARAAADLAACIRPISGGRTVLHEGGVYDGAWLESTVTISAEVLDRFLPEVTAATHLALVDAQRADGLLPYKVTPAGPAYSQIQMVTPLARCVWHHYRLTRDAAYLRRMYHAMTGHDAWLARHRDTRGTGGVEAFCTFDTGHDLSPRFWLAPDRCLNGDAARFDTDSPLLPYVAPDLTANVACQRRYLALGAAELGADPGRWRSLAAASEEALWRECFDGTDAMFYDRDATGAHVRVQSDVLLRVLASEIGDASFFASAASDYLLNSRKFLTGHGFTSLAMDDPRFDGDHTRNSWAGPVNFLSLIRAPHAFEHHGHVAELGLVSMPVLGALAAADRFPQCLDGWSGEPGFTELYSPAILWFLDTVERYCGILPRPDASLWFSGLTPTRLEHGSAVTAVGYARTIHGTRFELAGDDTSVVVLRDGLPHLAFPRGWRVVADATGAPTAVVGLLPRPVAGDLVVGDSAMSVTLGPNEVVTLASGERSGPAYVAPRF